MKNKKLLI